MRFNKVGHGFSEIKRVIKKSSQQIVPWSTQEKSASRRSTSRRQIIKYNNFVEEKYFAMENSIVYMTLMT